MTKCDIQTFFGAAIRNERVGQGISQEELADRAGLHRTYISDVERGVRNLSLGSIDRLAQALEIPVSTLFARSGYGGGPDMPVEILLVEDNPHDVELTSRAFERAKMSNVLHVVRDGAEALEFLSATGAFEGRVGKAMPGVILLDLKLPKIDGLEVLRRIKGDPRTQNIPVVVLTSSSQDRDILECRQLGSESYIVKPVDFYNFSETTSHLPLEWSLKQPLRGRGARFAGAGSENG